MTIKSILIGTVLFSSGLAAMAGQAVAVQGATSKRADGISTPQSAHWP